MRTVVVDGTPYEVSAEPFRVGEIAAAQDRHGRYMQGKVTRVGSAVVTIKDEDTRLHYTVEVERVYMRWTTLAAGAEG